MSLIQFCNQIHTIKTINNKVVIYSNDLNDVNMI